MLHARLWRSTPFRLAVTFGVMFIVAFLVSGIVTYQLLKRELSASLDRSIAETHAVVTSTYAAEDIEDMLTTVQTYAQLNSPNERVFLLEDAAGKKLAGNLVAGEFADGLSTRTAKAIGLKGEANYRLLSGKVGDKQLIVGQSFSETDRLEDIAFMSFGWATALAIVGAVGIGVFLGTRAQKRLDGIAHAMAAVSHGHLEARVPLRGNGDDIDEVSSQINQALGRLSILVDTMRQVSSDIAHELKTPLNRLKMHIEEAIGREEKGQPVEPSLLDARNEADQINATFEALLRISQIEAGARKTRFRDIHLQEIMLAVTEIYDDVAEDNGQSLSFSMGAGSDRQISGDRELLTQMFVNLVENAINHCPRGTGITLALSSSGGIATASVSDDGPGIPVDERDKVFRRLYRLDKSRTTNGSGLGLSLVRAIVDLHDGEVAIEDNNPGVRVMIRLREI